MLKQCVAFALINLAQADLPIHCTLRDVAGEWTFHMSPAQPLDHELLECGHSIPNTVESMLKIQRDEVVNKSTELPPIAVTLTEDIVESGEQRYLSASTAGGGKADMWTMVFDTGLEVRSGELSFAAHFHFAALPGATKTPMTGDSWQDIGEYVGRKGGLAADGDVYSCHCDRTSTGWWHRKLADGKLEGGCFWGEKKTSHLISEETSALVRLRPDGASSSTRSKLQSNATAQMGMGMFASQADASLEQEVRARTRGKEVIRKYGAETVGSSSPSAAAPKLSKPVSLRGVKAHVARESQAPAELPKTFDWRMELSDMTPPGEDPLGRQIDQGGCGSCYAFAGTLMLQMRFRAQLYRKHGIMYPLELSYKSVARCSPYTEGCSGGFSYFTSRVASEIGVPLAECDNEFPAAGLDAKCDWACYKNNTQLFYAKDYWHVGGFSQGSDEQSIMEEIYKNGPVELGFSTTAIPEFIVLNGESNENSTDVMTVINNEKVLREKYSTNPAVQQWWYSTHAIIGVGWGVDETAWGTVNYWIVRNSWGRTWGTGGYAKMRRGNNDGGIETDASMATPDMDKLPPGFLEKAQQYHDAQAPKRAEWKAQAPEGTLREVATERGTSTYCQNRPDSIDCN